MIMMALNCTESYGTKKYLSNLTSGSISIGDYSNTFNGVLSTLLQSKYHFQEVLMIVSPTSG
jgi:hypothetical protein